jgi:hypothetical protein
MQLLGPAVIDVIKLEKQANYSRILCGEQFLKLYAELYINFKQNLGKCIPLSNLLTDFDGKITINPNLLCHATKEAIDDKYNFDEHKDSLLNKLNELMHKQDKIIQSKYHPLIRNIIDKVKDYEPTNDDLLKYSQQ